MELEKFIIIRTQQTAKMGWVLSLDADVIDVMIPHGADIKEAEQGMRIIIELFTKELKHRPKPVKYYIWNKKQAVSGISDPNQHTEMISMDEALHNGQEAMHNIRKSKGLEKMSLQSMLMDGKPAQLGSIFNAKHKEILFLSEGYLMEIVEYPHRVDVVGFFKGPCIAIPMSLLNNLKVVGNETVVSTFDTKHVFSFLRQFKEARDIYKILKAENLARTDSYFADLKTKSAVERYMELIKGHAWVLKHVDAKDIASFLRISTEEYEKMQHVE